MPQQSKPAPGRQFAATTNTADQATQTLTTQWYNAVVQGLNLDSSTFQLVQGTMPLSTTSEQLWQLFDSVPPNTANTHYNPSGIVSFSQTYGDVISSLNPPATTTFQSAMGDYLNTWQTYLEKNPPTPPATVLSVLTNWTNVNMPPAQAAKAQTAYKQIFNSAIYIANSMWANMQNAATNPGVAVYSVTLEDVQNSLNAASTATATMTAQTSTSISNNFSGGAIEGGWDLFGVVDGSTYDSLTNVFCSGSVSATAQFSGVATVPGPPLSQPSSDPILSQYTPWYYSAALSDAFNNNSNTMWAAGADATWAGTFGPGGDLLQLSTELIVVNGMNLTISSSASFSSSQQSQWTTTSGWEFWPFYVGGGTNSSSSSVSFNSSGTATVTVTIPAGNPFIIGVTVTPIGTML
jgi:hypothetical protein